MRPVYERKSDREREARLAMWLGKEFGWDMKEMPQFNFCDYQAEIDGKLNNIEIKYRDIHWGQYPTIILSKDKFMKGLDRQVNHSEPFRFYVRHKTGLRCYEMDDYCLFDISFKQGGRKDRGDPKDIEEVADIPIQLFKEVRRDSKAKTHAHHVGS